MTSRSTPLAVAGLTIVALLAVQGLASFSAVPDASPETTTTTAPPAPATARVLAAVLADAVTLSPAALADPYGPESQRGPQMPVASPASSSAPAPVAPPEPASPPDPPPTTTAAPVVTTPPAPVTTTTEATTTTTIAETNGPTAPDTPVGGGPRDVEMWRPLVAVYFTPERVDEALRVIDCESHGDPDALNPYSGAAGLFQFLPSSWAWSSSGAGLEGASAFDPEANIAAAAWLVGRSIETGHSGGPWGHWVCKP